MLCLMASEFGVWTELKVLTDAPIGARGIAGRLPGKQVPACQVWGFQRHP